MPPEQKKQKPNEAKKREKPYVDWAKSAAKEIIMYDLQHGILSADDEDPSAETAWKFYQTLKEFEDVPYEQFKARLKDNRAQVRHRLRRSCDEEIALNRDRKLHPRNKSNHRNELVFDMSEAKELLRKDVKAKMHEKMIPSKLQATRDEYLAFKPEIFKQRIYQEVRYQKYLNYLEKKREEQKQKRESAFAA